MKNLKEFRHDTMLRWLKDIESWVFKVHETYAACQNRCRADKEFDMDFRETLRKIESERKIQAYYKNKEIEKYEQERKLEKQQERALKREQVQREVGKKKMQRFERQAHQKFKEKAKKRRGNPDFLAYLGPEIDMVEIADNAKVAAEENARRVEGERAQREADERRLIELRGEDDILF